MDSLGDWTDEDVLKWTESMEVLKQNCSLVCRDVVSNKCNITDIVEKLGPVLTNADVEKRRKGVEFLTELLIQVPEDFLPENQLKFILAFYNDRLKDHHSLAPTVLTGVLTLARMKNPAEEDVLRSLFIILSGAIITCQSQQREDRGKIFDLIIHCSGKYIEALMKRRLDYIQGVINAIEGERDPRNLLKLFEFMPGFLATYPLEHWADEMFEVFACYYPIDFYPSPNDPNAITRDGLAEKLGQCLLGCRDFIEPALVLALEKLETDLKVAKLDSLGLIGGCAVKFGCKEIEEKFDNVWMGLKQELLPGQNDDVVRMALNTVTVLVREAAKDDVILNNMLTVIFNSIAISLCDVNLRLFYPAVKITQAVGKSGQAACKYIFEKVTPIYLRQLKECEQDNEEKVKSLLGLLKDLASEANKQSCLKSLDAEIVREMETVFLDNLRNPDDDETRTMGCFGLMEVCEVTSKDTRSEIYQYLLQSLWSSTSGRSVTSAFVTQLSRHFPEELSCDFIKPLISNETSLNAKNSEAIFETLCTLLGPCKMSCPEIYSFIMAFIGRFSDTTLNLNDEIEGDEHSRILVSLLKALNGLLRDASHDHVKNILYKEYKLIDHMIKSKDKFNGDFVLEPLSHMIMLVLSGQSAENQQKVIEEYLPLLTVSEQNNDLFFSSGFLARCSTAVALDGKWEALALDLTRLSLIEGNPCRVRVCDHLLCFLFNRKYNNPDEFNRVLNEAVMVIRQAIKSDARGVRTLAWIAKGLLTQGHVKADELILELIGCLQDPNLSNLAADAFEYLAQSSELIYLPNERLFYKQKLFDLICKRFISENHSFDSVQLRALSRVVSELPPAVLRMELSKIGPSLFRCLEHEDPHTIHISLKLFHRLIDTDEKFVQDHIQFLIPQWLKLTQYKGNLHIRILSLKSLLAVTKFPTYILIPFKQDVLFSTVPSLDDHKRLVRVGAVETRTKWFLIDSPIKEK